MSFALKSVVVFFVAMAVDVAYTFYIRRAAQGKAMPAALWSGAIALAGSFNVLAYVNDRWLIAPIVAGYIVGTWWAVRRDATPNVTLSQLQKKNDELTPV